MNLFAQLDWDRQYRAVRRAPIRAYEGWHTKFDLGEPVPLTEEDIAKIMAPSRERRARQQHCLRCDARLTGMQRRFCCRECNELYVRFGRTKPTPQTCSHCQQEFLNKRLRTYCSVICEGRAQEALWEEHLRKKEQRRIDLETAAFEERRCKWAMLDAIPLGGSLTTTIDLSLVQAWANHVRDATIYAVGPGLLLVIRDSKDKLPDCLQ